LAVQGDRRVYRQRAILANAHGIHDRGAFHGRTIGRFALDGARRAPVGNFQGFLRRSPVGVNPLARHIGDEDIRPIQHTMPGVDAPPGIEPYRDLLPAYYFFSHVRAATPVRLAICVL
jgi:hypothetical protein